LLLNAGQENYRHKLFPAVFVDGFLEVRFIPAFFKMRTHPNVKILSLTDTTFLVRQINYGVDDPVLIARIGREVSRVVPYNFGLFARCSTNASRPPFARMSATRSTKKEKSPRFGRRASRASRPLTWSSTAAAAPGEVLSWSISSLIEIGDTFEELLLLEEEGVAGARTFSWLIEGGYLGALKNRSNDSCPILYFFG
jgi:hypothetical protein